MGMILIMHSRTQVKLDGIEHADRVVLPIHDLNGDTKDRANTSSAKRINELEHEQRERSPFRNCSVTWCRLKRLMDRGTEITWKCALKAHE
jgi:hypothetical protein